MALATDKGTSVLPVGSHGDEVGGRGQLDVQGEVLFDRRNGPIDLITFRHHFHVDVDRARAPPVQHGRSAAGEVDARGASGLPAESLHEALNPVQVRGFAHSAARSKLTSRRMSALYRACASLDPSCASRPYSRCSGSGGVRPMSNPSDRRRGAPMATSSASIDSRPAARSSRPRRTRSAPGKTSMTMALYGG